MRDYALTRTARRHLGEIRDYLGTAPEWIRNRELDKLLATFQQAADFRFSGRREPALKRGVGSTRSLLSHPYRIYYYPETFPLQIFAIRHGKRKPFSQEPES